MKYKLMAVDIDGTLLNSNGELTESTKAAIRQGVEKGLVFTIATGRPIQGVEYLINMLNLDLPFITYNGAMVVMGKSRKILYEQKLNAIDAKKVMDIGRKFDTTIIVWKNNSLYINRQDDKAEAYKKINNVPPILIEDEDELLKGGVTKIVFYDDIENIEKYQEQVGQFLESGVNYHTSRPYLLEFVDENASKAIAMEKLGEHYGIDRSEMIAVGDGFNDLSMIEYAGLGVAMANAKEAIRKKADYVTLSNDEDGVAHVIRKFVL